MSKIVAANTNLTILERFEQLRVRARGPLEERVTEARRLLDERMVDLINFRAHQIVGALLDE